MMKSIRRGLGRGKGMGYKNLVPHDKPVHRDSGRGIKQPQIKSIPPMLMKPMMRKTIGKKWDGSMDSGSEWARLRQKGYSHDEAVASIEGKKVGGLGDSNKPIPDDFKIAIRGSKKFLEIVGKSLELGMSQREAVNIAEKELWGKYQQSGKASKEKVVGGLGDKKYGVFDAYGFIITAFDKKEDADKYAQANKGGDFFVKEVEIEDHTKEKIVGGLGKIIGDIK